MIEFNKVPAAKTLETLDPLTRYEYKVQVVSQLEKILGPRAMASESPTDRVSAKNADKSARRKRDDTTYLGMGSELLTAALLERCDLILGLYYNIYIVQILREKQASFNERIENNFNALKPLFFRSFRSTRFIVLFRIVELPFFIFPTGNITTYATGTSGWVGSTRNIFNITHFARNIFNVF